MTDRLTIIAEAGVNHNGDPVLARELVAAAAEAGVDIVKFQTFKAKNLVTETAEKAAYQKENSGADETQLAMLKKLELDDDLHFDLMECCKKHDIDFLSTAFDSESLNFLTKDVGIRTLKVPSGEITNGPFLLEHAQTGHEIILSTGMSTLAEVEAALAVLAHGYLFPDQPVHNLNDCYQAYITAESRNILLEKVILLHCTSQYPTPPKSVNLRAMDTLSSAFGLRVGYSDHTQGITASVAAAARGACLIEKHFTLDKNMEGPDHIASLDPNELADLVNGVREVESMLGHSTKVPDPLEMNTRDVVRKSIVATVPIKEGTPFLMENISVMRPGTGISPMEYWSILNKVATKGYSVGELI